MESNEVQIVDAQRPRGRSRMPVALRVATAVAGVCVAAAGIAQVAHGVSETRDAAVDVGPGTTPATAQVAPPTAQVPPPTPASTSGSTVSLDAAARSSARATGLQPAERSLLTLILLGSSPAEWDNAVQQMSDVYGRYALDEIINALPAQAQQALADGRLPPDMVQPIVQTMLEIYRAHAADGVISGELQRSVQVQGAAMSCALGGGGLVHWEDGAYAGCIS